MVIAHHLIRTAYGRWLPNDPSRSASNRIRNHTISTLGEVHHRQKAIQPAGWEIRQFYKQAPSVLKHALLTFSSRQRDIIAASLAETIAARKYTCYACAVMPDHLHVLIRKHRDTAEQMIANLQQASRDALRSRGSHPPDHPVWRGGGWKVFQDRPDDIRRTIAYIRANPTKMRMPSQQWPFVQPYNGWPLHEGHNPNSPYANRQHGQPFKKK